MSDDVDIPAPPEPEAKRTTPPSKRGSAKAELSETERYQLRLHEQATVTSQISNLCRLIGLGGLVVFFTVTGGSEQTAFSLWENKKTPYVLIGVFGALTIFFDYLQYLFAFFSASEAMSRTDKPNRYKTKSALYKGRSWCFYTKQVSAFVCGLAFIAVVLGLKF